MPTSARLPLVFFDEDNWGQILNDFLLVSHNPDGTLKSSIFGGFNPDRVAFSNSSGILVDDSGFTYNPSTDTLAVPNILSSIISATTVGAITVNGATVNATTVNATTLSASALVLAILTTKGDLIVGSGSSVTARLPAGVDNKFLKTRAAATLGMEWEDVDRIKEGGGQVLTLGAVADQQPLVRSGNTVVGTLAPTIQIITTLGANTWNKPANLRYVRVRVWGGGGGGGAAAEQAFGAAGGGGGGYSEKLIAAASLSNTETATIGAGGAGVAGSPVNGGTGGTSSFGAHCSATGGQGATNGGFSGGNGGSGSGGNINMTGGGANMGTTQISALFPYNVPISGIGGGAAAGGGGGPEQSWAYVAGIAGNFPGGGGSGANITGTGGNGAQGLIVVEEFYA